MNQKVARMLRDMRSTSKTDKRIWNSLTHLRKGVIRGLYKSNKKLLPPSLKTLTERV